MNWKHVDGPRLRQYYLDAGDASQPVVFALHGWPDAPQTWRYLLPVLRQAGWRVITPYLRGFGPNRFISSEVPRSGQLSALADDIRQLADALAVQRFAVVGHDWGARCAYILSALWPERISHCIALSVGYSPGEPPSLTQTQQYWYQWFMATPQGRQAVEQDRQAFCQHLWRTWAANWRYDAQSWSFAEAAMANPDWAAITLHSYTQRWGNAVSDPAYTELEQRLADKPAIDAPSLIIHGEADGCNLPETSANLSFFHGPIERLTLPGVGHFPQHEARDQVNQAIRRWLMTSREAE